MSYNQAIIKNMFDPFWFREMDKHPILAAAFLHSLIWGKHLKIIFLIIYNL